MWETAKTAYRALAAVLALALIACAGAQAAHPGQNGKLAFYATVEDVPPPDPYDSSTDQVFTINPDGTGLQQLTHGTVEDSQYPVWSPDGQTIAFDRHQYDPPRLWLMDGDGSTARALPTRGFPGGWSPDGVTLVVSLDGELWTARTDGSPLTRVTGASSLEFAPRFSPDGTQIVFTSNFNTIDWQSDIYTVKADLSEDWVRLVGTYGTDTSPDYSPDGSKIVFSSNRSGSYDLWVMDPDGTDQMRLTTSAEEDSDPVWSPDGSRIAFSRRVIGYRGELYVMNADGSGQTRITNNELDERLTDWQSLPNRVPDCAAVRAEPSVLRQQPKPRLVPVRLEGAVDPDGDAVAITIAGVTQDEPVGRRPDARLGSDPAQVDLRAQRRPRGDGRVYRISFTAADGFGGECTGTATVEVRRHRNRPAVDSAPPSYDSLGP